MDNNQKNIDIFDKKAANIAKAGAVFFMIWHHTISCFMDDYMNYPISSVFVNVTRIYEIGIRAKMCVSVFVLITAYGITKKYLRKEELPDNIHISSVNSAVKLFMNFLFCFLLTLATSFLVKGRIKAVYSTNGRFSALSALYLVFDMFGVAAYFETPTLNETWWYMSIAYAMIFLIPICIMFYKKIGVHCLWVAVFAGFLLKNSLLTEHVFCIFFGIWAASENVFCKFDELKISNQKYINSVIKAFFLLLVCFVCYYAGYINACTPIVNTIIAASVCVIASSISKNMKYFSGVLAFLGKHSMNIFLIHTMIFEYYFKAWVYSFKLWFIIIIVVYFASFIISLIIELLKKLIRYDRITNRLLKGIVDKNGA